jgi:hypothetical protein
MSNKGLYNRNNGYRLIIKPSKTFARMQQLLPFVVASCSLLLFYFSAFFSSAVAAFLWSIVLFLMVFLWIVFWQQRLGYLNNLNSKNNFKNQYGNVVYVEPLIVFELNVDGSCIFYQWHNKLKGQLPRTKLTTQSRVSFLGAWLYFEKTDQAFALPQINKQPLFIFRDSLSTQEFSRLARTINSLAHLSDKAKI